MTVRVVPRPHESPLWPWMLVSGIVHALIALVAIGTMGAGLLVEGRGVADGDGFGGRSVELEIRGPADRLPTGSTPAASAAPMPVPTAAPVEDPDVGAEEDAPVPPPEPEAEEGALAVSAPEPAPRPPPRPVGAQPRPGSSPVEAEGAPEGDEESAPGEGEAAGTGGDESTAGVQAGDPSDLILRSAGLGDEGVSARSLLLPNGGVCEDPVVGTWRAQKFRASDRTWVRFTLRVRRGDGEALRGTIDSRIWSGRASEPSPGECTAFGSDHTWRMDARGSLRGTEMRFGARRARLIAEHCPRAGIRYAPDRFRGTLHPLREVFDAVNNDGAFDIDEPYTFRRVSCDP